MIGAAEGVPSGESRSLRAAPRRREPPRRGGTVRDAAPTSGFEEVTLRDGERQLGSVVAEWRDLAARIDASSFFQTPDWVLAWWEDRGRPPTRIGLWRDASD